MSCFGHLFQRCSSSKGTGTLLSLVIFRNSTVFNHMLSLVMFPIDPSLFTWSKLLSHLGIPSVLCVRNGSVPMLSLYLLFLPPFSLCCSVGHAGQHVCAWFTVDISIRRPVQPTLVLLALMSPRNGTVTSGQEWHSVPQTPILLCAAWLFKLSLGFCLKVLLGP